MIVGGYYNVSIKFANISMMMMPIVLVLIMNYIAIDKAFIFKLFQPLAYGEGFRQNNKQQ